jgi:cobalt/nickel transport system ATP-binding protein
VANPAVRVDGLRVTYPDGRAVAIVGAPFVVDRGERVAILGPNGSGKSTLLRAVLGLARTSAGTVEVLGHDPAREFEAIRPRVGAVLQDVEAQLLAPTVGQDLALGLAGRGLSRAEVDGRVAAIAREFNLTDLLDKVPHYLSGGERRKVALAGALVTEPELLVLDEPFAGLDPRSRLELSHLIRADHQQRRITLILTTHEVQEVPALVDTVYLLSEQGELVGRGSPAEIFARPDLLLASNVEPPPLTRLLAALAERGERIPPSNDPDEVARALLAWREAGAPVRS